MTDSMKFGPEWLRHLSRKSDNMVVPKYQLANFRYGREEMLALFDKNVFAPEPLCNIPVLHVQDTQLPLALVQMTEDEILTWNSSVNSDLVTMKQSKSSVTQGASSITSNCQSLPGKQQAPVPIRGRGRGTYIARNYEDCQEPMNTTFGRPRYDRNQGHVSGDRTSWPERNGNYDHGEWSDSGQENGVPGNLRKDFGTSLRMQSSRDDTNWRRRPATDEDDVRKHIRHNDKPGRTFIKSWRDGGGERDRDKEHGEVVEGVKDRRWTSRLPSTAVSRRRNSETKDDHLPEWINENQVDHDGSFDSSGAFHGSSNYNTNEDKERNSKNKLKKATAQLNDKSKHVKFRFNKDTLEEEEETTSPETNDEEEVESTLKVSHNKKDLKISHPPQNQKLTSARKKSMTSMEKNDHNDKSSRNNTSYRSNSEKNAELDDCNEREESGKIIIADTAKCKQEKFSTESLQQDSPMQISHQNANHLTTSENNETYNGLVLDMITKIVDDEEKLNVSQDRTEDINKWFYRDPQGEIQGPFSSLDMGRWYSKGFFQDANMLIKRACETQFYAFNDLLRINKLDPFSEITLPFNETMTSSSMPAVSSSPSAMSPESTQSVGQDPRLLLQQYPQMQYPNLLSRQPHDTPAPSSTAQHLLLMQHITELMNSSPGASTVPAATNMPLNANFVPPIQQPTVAAAANTLLGGNSSGSPNLATLLAHYQQRCQQQLQYQQQFQQQLRHPLEANLPTSSIPPQVMPIYRQQLEAAQSRLQNMNVGSPSSIQLGVPLSSQPQQSPYLAVGNLISPNPVISPSPPPMNNPAAVIRSTLPSNHVQNFLNHYMENGERFKSQTVQIQNSVPKNTNVLSTNNGVTPTTFASLATPNLLSQCSEYDKVETLWGNDNKNATASSLPSETPSNSQQWLSHFDSLRNTASEPSRPSGGLWTGDATSTDINAIIKTEPQVVVDVVRVQHNAEYTQPTINNVITPSESVSDAYCKTESPSYETELQNYKVESKRDDSSVSTKQTMTSKKPEGKTKKQQPSEEAKVKTVQQDKKSKNNKTIDDNNNKNNNKAQEERKTKEADQAIVARQIEEKKLKLKEEKKQKEEEKKKKEEEKRKKEEEKKKKLEEEKRKKEEQHKKEQENKKRAQEEKKKEEKERQERRRKIEEEKREARELAKKEMLRNKEIEEEIRKLEQQKKQEEALRRLHDQQLAAAANNKLLLKQTVAVEASATSSSAETSELTHESKLKKRQKNNKQDGSNKQDSPNKQNSSGNATNAWAETKKVPLKTLSEIQSEEQKQLIKKKEQEKTERERKLQEEIEAAAAAKINETPAKTNPWSIPCYDESDTDSLLKHRSVSCEPRLVNAAHGVLAGGRNKILTENRSLQQITAKNTATATNARNQKKNQQLPPAKQSSSNHNNNNTNRNHSKSSTKNSNNNIVKKKDDFFKWGVKSLSRFQQSSQFDVPTCVNFLREVSTLTEITDYVRELIGENKEASEFVSQFVERRICTDGPLDDIAVGAISYSSSTATFPNVNNTKQTRKNQQNITAIPAIAKTSPKKNVGNDANNRNPKNIKKKPVLSEQEKLKKAKKKQMMKVDQNIILGFSVTAAADRVNVGDVDYGEQA